MDRHCTSAAVLLLLVTSAAAYPNYGVTDGCSRSCALPVAQNLRVEYTNSDENFNVTLMWDVAPLPSAGPQSYCKGLFRWMARVQLYLSRTRIIYALMPGDFGVNSISTVPYDAKSPWITLGSLEQSTSFSNLSGQDYYLFQIMHNFTCNDSRTPQLNTSYVYRFGQQTTPTVYTDTPRVVVTEGDNVQLICYGRGIPLPRWTWAIDLTVNPNSNSEQNTPVSMGVLTLNTVKLSQQGRYWCIGTNFLVNPPQGKRSASDMTYIDLIVKPQAITCKSDNLNTVLDLCYSYLSGQTSIYYNQTHPPNPATISSYFAAIDAAVQNTSGCADAAKELICFSMFPFCDPASSEPRPLPVCSRTCDAFTQGQCGALFNKSSLLPMMTSTCGLSTPVSGDSPECIMSSRLAAGNKTKTGGCLSGNGRGYHGSISVTASGLPCQQWSVQDPQKHIITPNTYPEDLKDSSVFCRNPGGLGERPWCYTTDPQTRWEYCNIPKCETCDQYSGSFCSGFGFNAVYVNRQVFPNGQVDIEARLQRAYTELITQSKVSLSSGCNTLLHMFLCQRALPGCAQNGTTPLSLCQEHCNLLSVVKLCLGETLTGQLLGALPEASLQCSESRKSNPGCLPLPQWDQFGTLQADTQVDCYEDGEQSYNGSMALSETGSGCQQWSNSTYMTSLFPALVGSKNYCRNPGGLGTRPWCFTDKGRMEYCSVPQCKATTLQEKSVDQSTSDNNTTLIITMIALVGLIVIILIIVGVGITLYRNRPSAMQNHAKTVQPLRASKNSISLQPNPHYFTLNIPFNLQPTIDTFTHLDRSRVQYIKELGKGNFGVVFLGKVDHLKEGEGEVMVAVKTLKDKTSEVLESFVSEAKIMFSFDHTNIVKIYAVCMKETPYYMVFEYMDKGDLAHFLQENASSYQKQKRNPFGVHERTESSISNSPAQLSCDQLTDVCKQIASGMDYLSKKNHIHRDLACRNCLVSSPMNVKIGDFGMSQNLYTRDYYRVNGKAVLPIRWMSPEAVVYGKFTTQSDVWSFGVVMWEVFSFAMQPYYGVTNEEVTQMIRKGKHLNIPPDCPDKIYDIMSECWNMDPSCRPTFSELYDMLLNYHSSNSTDEGPSGGCGLNDSSSLSSDVFSEVLSCEGDSDNQAT